MTIRKKRKTRPSTDELRPTYDFRDGVRGKYAARLQPGSSVVILDPDVAAAYPTSAAVNRALRAIMAARPDTSSRRTRIG